MINEYYKNKLNQRSQIFYENMLDAFIRLQSTVSCKKGTVSDISDAYVALYNDHPELFYLSHAPKIMKKVGIFGGEISIISNFIFLQAEILQNRQLMDKIAKSFLALVNQSLDENEIEKKICDFIIKNTNYEINNVYNQNAATVLVKGKGQCSGIAKAVKFIMDYIDIECIIVDGIANDVTTGMSGPHNWNIVKIDGQYYHLDVTFMLGANISKNTPFNYKYLNYSDNQMSITHQWDRAKYPQCNKSNVIPYNSNNYNGGKNYGGYTHNTQKIIYSYLEFRNEIKKVFNNKESKFVFISKITSNDAQGLVNNLLNETMAEGENYNIGFSVNIKMLGEEVTIDIIWN